MAAPTVLYLLNNTDDTRRIVLQPYVIDGAQDGAVQRSTDLTLYGNGAQLWGERFNENFLRLAENFAIAESNLNDQTSGDPYPAWNPRPQSETDAGGPGYGFGINYPVEGQLWFNKSRKAFYVNNGGGQNDWHSIVKVPVTGVVNGTDYGLLANTIPNPQPGDLVWDAGALKVWNGTAWVNSAGALGAYVLKAGDTMTGFLTLHSNPTFAMHAATKQYVDGLFVYRSGDTMTGFLTLHATPVLAMHAATKQYVDAAVAGVGGGGGGTTNHSLLTNLGADDHGQYVSLSGNALRNYMAPGDRTITLGRDPTAALEAATKQYVDAQLGGGGGSDMPILLATGVAAHNTLIPYPTGYSAATCFIIHSIESIGDQGGGSGIDYWITSANPEAAGFRLSLQYSIENSGGLRTSIARIRYWILKNGTPNFAAVGINVANESALFYADTYTGNTSITGGYRLKADGTARTYRFTNILTEQEYAANSTWLNGGYTATDYQVLATVTSGSLAGGSSPTGTWLRLGNSPGVGNIQWFVSATDPTPASATLTLQFRDYATSTLITSISVTLYAGFYSSYVPPGGGGGGGGGSIYVKSFLPFYEKTAGEFTVGDQLLLLSDDRSGTKRGEVISHRISEQNLVQLTSESGITLTCSDNTPLTLEDGSAIYSINAAGHKLPVQDEIGGFRWETITSVKHLGRGDVITIYCKDQCYAAGDVPGRWIWTHNDNVVKN